MSNETKRDVLVDAVDALADAQASGGNVGHQDANLFMAEYEKALPDDLPVIPVEIANAIEEYRDRFGSAKGLNELITDMNVPWKLGVLETVTAIPEIILGVFRGKTDVLARAWLDGYEIDNKS